MERKNKIDLLLEQYSDLELLKADGFDDAIIGIDLSSERIVYDINTMTNILIDDGMEELDAIEYLEYNVLNAYVGEKTPIYINSI
jgi:predicted RNA-binding protein Jag